MTTTGKPPALFLLIGDHHGIYIPQIFVRDFDMSAYDGLSAWDVATCADPDNEGYWDAWVSILDSATLTMPEGYTYHLHQDGDLWLYCAELMTDEEYHNFFGVAREPDPEPTPVPEPEPVPVSVTMHDGTVVTLVKNGNRVTATFDFPTIG
jgi:hypothetical protein